jgi:hypothetical protein
MQVILFEMRLTISFFADLTVVTTFSPLVAENQPYVSAGTWIFCYQPNCLNL